MKKFFLIPIMLIFSTPLNAQEMELIVGRNFTTYDYTNSQGESNPKLNGSSGNYFEISYNVPFDRLQNLKYSIGLALNQFNATGGDYTSNYSWDTNYFGLKSGLIYSILPERSFVDFNVKTGFGINRIINGQQKINGATFDLSNNEDFTSVSVQPYLGLELKYDLGGFLIGFGYNYSKNFSIANGDEEKLDFNNSRLEFGIMVPMN